MLGLHFDAEVISTVTEEAQTWHTNSSRIFAISFFILFLRDDIVTFTFKSKHSFLA